MLAPFAPIPTGLLEDAPQRADRDVSFRVRHHDDAACNQRSPVARNGYVHGLQYGVSYDLYSRNDRLNAAKDCIRYLLKLSSSTKTKSYRTSD